MGLIPENKKLILFDGVCNLCNASIQYVIKHDKKNIFLFTPLDSEIAKHVIKTYQIDSSTIDSIILYEPTKGVKIKSSAALQIASKLGFPRNLLTIFFIIPPFIRNWVYDFVAKNRYKWYGKREECMIPTKELKQKFV